MSLFTELFTLTKARRLAMLVSSDHDSGLLTISVMPRPQSDSEGPYCKDLTLTAKPEEFDTGFLDAIGSYRRQLLPLLDQAKAAAQAIESTAQKVRTAPTAKPPAKDTRAKNIPASDTQENRGAGITAQAKAYRDASSGDEGDDDEPDNEWMKNRQPELF
jgi:PRTRC genetic system protein E